jgi:prepilin signal peptidase PulO-like enzyme (type II secretory pathway)
VSTTATPPEIPATRPPLTASVHDGLAIASLVLGILYLGGIGALLAVIFGHLSRKAARLADRQPSGMATAGLILGWIGLALTVVLVIVLIAALASHPATTPIQPGGVQSTDIWSACHTASPPPYCG